MEDLDLKMVHSVIISFGDLSQLAGGITVLSSSFNIFRKEIFRLHIIGTVCRLKGTIIAVHLKWYSLLESKSSCHDQVQRCVHRLP